MKKKKGVKKPPYLFEEILTLLKKNPNHSFNYKQIASRLDIRDDSDRGMVPSILAELESKELIESPERGKYKLKKRETVIAGTVDISASGAAYVSCEGYEEDIYVSPRNALNAMKGDTVNVSLFPGQRGRRQEGEITEVVKRAKTEIVGTVQLSARFAFLIPNGNRAQQDIYIPLEKINGAKHGQVAIARITEWPENGSKPSGEIIDVLGEPGENDTEMHSILAEFGLPYSFPSAVEKVADHIPTKITEDEIARRRDFRKVTTFTIDPLDAKDFDDALSIQKLSNGNWEIGVHIADVTHYVKEDSAIDKEAVSRATSVYLVDRVVPMLPEILSNNVCSLRPKEDKLCFSAVFELNENAQIISEWFGRTIIHSDRRFTYEEAQEILESRKGDFCEEMLQLDKLAKKLREARFKKGSIAFDKEEVKFYLDEKGNPTGVYFKKAKDSNKLIEDFMLLANKRVAEFAGKNKAAKATGHNSFVYRVHDLPDPEKLKSLSLFVKRFGYNINPAAGNIATSLNKMLEDAADKPHSHVVETLTIRSMAKAEYSTKNIGHYGLSFEHYTHFTSPIRRYPDMLVHRLLQQHLDLQNGKKDTVRFPKQHDLEELCKHSSGQERMAADAERASVRYKQIQFMEDKVGRIFEGIISGVTEWGIYVEIIENKCEGMVRLKDMMDDVYVFDEENYRVYGKRRKKVYGLGDKVKIKVKRADLVRKQMDFQLI